MREPWITALWCASGGIIGGLIIVFFLDGRPLGSAWANHLLLIAAPTVGGFFGGWRAALKQINDKTNSDV